MSRLLRLAPIIVSSRNTVGGAGGAFYLEWVREVTWRCCLGDVTINTRFGRHTFFKWGDSDARDGKQHLFLSLPTLRDSYRRNRFFSLTQTPLGALYYDREHFLNA